MALTEEQLKALGLDGPAPDPSAVMPAGPQAMPAPIAAAAPVMPQSSLGAKIPSGALIPTTHAEGKAEYSELMPRITAAPGTADYFRQRQQQLDFKTQHPWGDPISAHPGVLGKIGHVASTIGNIAGSIVAPGTMALIPGTQLHNNLLEAENEHGITEGEENAGREATAGKTQADTKEAEARTRLTNKQADELGQPKPKEEKWNEFTGYTDADGTPLLHEENSGQVVRASDKKPPTGFKQAAPKSDRPDTPEQQFIDEFQRAHKGATVAQALAAYTYTTQKPEHDQRQLGVTPDGSVIEIHPGMKLPAGTQTITGQIKAQQGEEGKNTAINYANDYLQRGTYTGPGDEALMEKFFEMAKPSSGFRMTEPQMAMLRNAQGWMNSFESKARHALSGTWFSDTQRKQIVDTMNELGQAHGGAGGGGNKAPAVGTVENGYRFKGGNAADQNNWEKVAQ